MSAAPLGAVSGSLSARLLGALLLPTLLFLSLVGTAMYALATDVGSGLPVGSEVPKLARDR